MEWFNIQLEVVFIAFKLDCDNLWIPGIEGVESEPGSNWVRWGLGPGPRGHILRLELRTPDLRWDTEDAARQRHTLTAFSPKTQRVMSLFKCLLSFNIALCLHNLCSSRCHFIKKKYKNNIHKHVCFFLILYIYDHDQY